MSESWEEPANHSTHDVPKSPPRATDFGEDEVFQKRIRSGGRGPTLLLLFLLLLGMACAALFYYFQYLPLESKHAKVTELLAKHEARLHDLEAGLASVKKERDALKVERDTLLSERNDLAGKVAEREALIAELKAAQDALQATFGSEIQAGEMEIRGGKGTLSVDLKEKILFPSGEASLSDKGKDVLRRVASELVRLEGRAIQVGGHSDNQPLSKALKERFPTNWELSTARATNVVRFLTDECNVPPERLVAAGFSQYRPVSSNHSKKGRARNRRIELQVVAMP